MTMFHVHLGQSVATLILFSSCCSEQGPLGVIDMTVGFSLAVFLWQIGGGLCCLGAFSLLHILSVCTFVKTHY